MLLLTCTSVAAQAACRSAEPAAVRLARTQMLPELDGRALRVSLVEVTYAPGESSPRHGHGCPVIGYVVDGAVRMHVEGQQPDVYRRGETFYEPKGSVHLVSANESREFPARFLAWFICDADAPLSVALTDPQSTKEDRQ
jgi:quercetin dioxygenase-like cupin family protein